MALVEPLPVPLETSAARTATGAASDEPTFEPATTTSTIVEEPIIGLIPPISVVRPQPGLREAAGPVTVVPAAHAPTIVRVLGVQAGRPTLPATGMDTGTPAMAALVMLVTGSAFLSWVGRRASDRL